MAIGRPERFVADWHRAHSTHKERQVEPSGKRVAIVGAGPAGMTCTLSLSEAGFQVSVYEKEDHTGGVDSWGIPAFVLPRNLLTRLSEQMLA